jgi:hypothetical protein
MRNSEVGPGVVPKERDYAVAKDAEVGKKLIMQKADDPPSLYELHRGMQRAEDGGHMAEDRQQKTENSEDKKP